MDAVSQVISFLEASKYVLLFAGSYLEGTVVMMTGGILWHLGEVQFWPAYIALMLGDFLSDMMWYAIGYFGARRFVMRWGHFLNATPAVIEKAERRFHKHHTAILIVSKLTMGFGLAVPVLLTAGMLRVPLSRYIGINVLGGIVWIFAIMCVGYFFGNLLENLPPQSQLISGVAIVVGFFFAVRAINARLAKSDW